MRLTVDTPQDGVLRSSVSLLQVTCVEEQGPVGQLAFSVAGVPLAFGRWPHPELARACGAADAAGLSVIVDLSDHLAVASTGTLPVDVDLGGARAGTLALTVADGCVAAAERDREGWAAKRTWLGRHLRCPVCHGAQPQRAEGDLRCPACGTLFPQRTRALDLLTPGLAQASHLEPTGLISANAFDTVATGIIEHVRGRGGKVLDNGAGLRTSKDPAVINLEIVDYATTDVIAVGQHLPFPDETFDAVLSLAVLEHVSQPFECAREIARVLRPGGIAYVAVPFLQHEHGYPHHYYNMTRRGLVNLFEGRLDPVRQFVPRSGAPIGALHCFLHRYSANLQGAAKDAFLGMTVRELMALDPQTSEHPIVTGLAPAGEWILAATTAAVLTKPQRSA